MKTADLLKSAITLYHVTSKNSAEKILKSGWELSSGQRLIPSSISFSKTPLMWTGDTVLKVRIHVSENDILRIAINKTKKEGWQSFYELGDEDDSNLQIGKLWFEEAKKQKKKLVIISGVPNVGTEYAVLDVSIIEDTTQS